MNNKELRLVHSLTAAEKATLRECEVIIDRGLNTFVEVGESLLKIRDTRLYRDTHSTFESYCRERWSMSRQHASHLIGAVRVVANLSTKVVKPTHETQLRPLAGLAPEDQRAVWGQAVTKSNGAPPTAKTVNEVKKTMSEGTYKPEPKLIRFKLSYLPAKEPEPIRVTVSYQPVPQVGISRGSSNPIVEGLITDTPSAATTTEDTREKGQSWPQQIESAVLEAPTKDTAITFLRALATRMAGGPEKCKVCSAFEPQA